VKLVKLLLGLLGAYVKQRPQPRREDIRVVPAGDPDRRAENWLLVLLLLATACSVAFVVFYALDRLPRHTQLFGASLGGAFLLLGASGILIARRLIVTEELEDEYPAHEHPPEQERLVQTVEESGSRFTRKRMLLGAGGAAFGALGVALITPALSFGPALEVAPFYETGWRRGKRLVDEGGRPYRASDIEEKTFYTAFPEGESKETLGAPLVVVRLPPDELRLPADRKGWAPHGILAYSKICTHAACAIALYRVPTFPPTQPGPALVCPCHYSTFDPASGGTVLFGPAGRPLPQLPLEVDGAGYLRAGGNFDGPVGPAWWGVRNRGATT
jgi:ubiquinol-cytochrome c reductase iron-sulfur subunit